MAQWIRSATLPELEIPVRFHVGSARWLNFCHYIIGSYYSCNCFFAVFVFVVEGVWGEGGHVCVASYPYLCFLSASGECSNYAEWLSSIEWHKAHSGCGGIGGLCHNLKPSFCSATSPRAAAAERSSKIAAPMSPAVLTSVKQGTVASGARRAHPEILSTEPQQMARDI